MRFFRRQPQWIKKLIVITIIIIQDLREILKFSWIIFLLYLCSHITLKQLILIYLAIIIGILLSLIAPIISFIYTIPDNWIELKPAMVLFSKFSHQNLEKVNSLPEKDLKEAVEKFISVSEIIRDNFTNSPEMLRKYSEIGEVFQDLDTTIKKAKDLYEEKKQYRKEQKLSSGVPPINDYQCPKTHPIRATNGDREAGIGGIYYFPDERRGVKVYWCFANVQEAEVNKFRRPLRKPPKRQP